VLKKKGGGTVTKRGYWINGEKNGGDLKVRKKGRGFVAKKVLAKGRGILASDQGREKEPSKKGKPGERWAREGGGVNNGERTHRAGVP